jgi:hypothetical protein
MLPDYGPYHTRFLTRRSVPLRRRRSGLMEAED